MRDYDSRFLPVSKSDMEQRGWHWYDFLIINGDAYVDHPSFGGVVIARLLEAEGYRVAYLAQPDWHSADAIRAMGKPRLGTMLSAGNLDSMVAHYTAARKRRHQDFYSPGCQMGLRPDRATIVYANRVREAFGDLPLVIGGLEASLRRFAHYDYWSDKVRRSALFDAKADLLVYGMGEAATLEIAHRLESGTPVSEITDVRGTAYAARDASGCPYPMVEVASYEEVAADKTAYAMANEVEYEEHDPVRGKAILQKHGSRYLIVNPPQMPLEQKELDRVAELPYVREYHPMYEEMGGVPSLTEVKFSVIHNRGCIGGCNFCALAFHQGRMMTCRSHESVVREVTELTKKTDFKGYINDVGGPTANLRYPSCKKQLKHGMCPKRNCLTPTPCPNLEADESDYVQLLRKLRAIPGIKKVFVRSGVRYDYMLCDKKDTFFRELVQYHVSGQLKVAPEHCIDSVLDYMGKPHIDVYEKFQQKYISLNKSAGKSQFLVPYLMSSHPGSDMKDAIALAEFLNKMHRVPEQVQDFYPVPGCRSTCMYYTGIDPRTMKSVYVERDGHRKNMQRALLQYRVPENWKLVKEALIEAGREDLIGFDERCLIRPYPPKKRDEAERRPNRSGQRKDAGGQQAAQQPKKADNRPQKGKNAPKKSDVPRKGTDGKKPHRDSRPPKNRGKQR